MSEVIKAFEFPDQEFVTRDELYAALKESASELIALKRSAVKESQPNPFPLGKATGGSTVKAVQFKKGYVYPVINTTKYMDSHNDVHLDNIWNRTIKDQAGNTYYVADHKIELKNIIAYPKDVKPMVIEIPWKSLNANYAGKTQALVFEVDETKIRMKEAREVIDERIDIQHSVRMQYVKVSLAINSKEPDFKAEKAVWDKYISSIANKDRAEEVGYFWAIEEAKIIQEGSMLPFGSNNITPMVYPKCKEVAGGTPTVEPLATAKRKLLF